MMVGSAGSRSPTRTGRPENWVVYHVIFFFIFTFMKDFTEVNVYFQASKKPYGSKLTYVETIKEVKITFYFNESFFTSIGS